MLKVAETLLGIISPGSIVANIGVAAKITATKTISGSVELRRQEFFPRSPGNDVRPDGIFLLLVFSENNSAARVPVGPIVSGPGIMLHGMFRVST